MVNQIKHSQYIDLINLLEDLGASPEKCQSFFSVALKLPDLQDLELDYAFDIIKSYALENGIDLKDYLFSNYMNYNDFYIRLYSKIEKEILKNYISHNSYRESKKSDYGAKWLRYTQYLSDRLQLLVFNFMICKLISRN